ncbi:MAG: hypothetical protein E3K37_05635 [Candidatus Kuenenia sp.]|nr:hypothetical protein [Candidatus Kuenenia hertensis]
MKKYFCIILAVVFIFIFARVSSSYDRFVLFFSGEEQGALIPCGCFEGQLGGISRRDTLLNSYKKQGIFIIAVSTGDLIKSPGRQEEIKMGYLLNAMKEMDCLLHNLGEKDFEIGPQALSFASQTNGINFLSGNIEIISPFPIKYEKYLLKELSGFSVPVKIAFLSIISESVIDAHLLDFIRVYNPLKSLKPVLNHVKEKADLIVLVSHAPLEESIEIAESFPEIGLVISGHDIEEPAESLTYVNETPVISHGTEGKYVVIADYVVKNGKIKNKSVEAVPLEDKIEESEKMQLLLKQYQQTLKEEDLLNNIPKLPLEKGSSYIGSSVCGTCHKKVYTHWLDTSHQKAYTTLSDIGQQYDPECVNCHTDGFGYVSGFADYETHQNLAHVGCESCHGAGSNHLNNIGEPYGLADEKRCLECHNSDHSPKFQYENYWEKIKHPKEILSNISENTQ